MSGSRVTLLPLLVALACQSGAGDSASASGGSSTGTQTGSSSTAATTEPTSSGSGSASAGTTIVTGITGAVTTSTDATTTTDTTASTAGSTSTDSTSTTSSSTSDTGGPDACGVADGDYGDCALPLGWAFDGSECTARSGCDCAPDCDKFFPDPAACALTCAAAGHCNEDRLDGAGLAREPVLPGQLCDEVDVCPASEDLKTIFEAIFGMLTCEGGGFPCPGACQGLYQNTLGPDEWLQTCAATLVQGGGTVHCVVFGP